MTQEDKQLVLIDICGRLPHNVICSTIFGDAVVLYVDIYEGTIYIPCNEWVCDFKPYLRPMSSMTEEEKELCKGCIICYNEFEGNSTLFDTEGLDYLNKNMYDYRGLIEKGLALIALEGMYNKIEKQ